MDKLDIGKLSLDLQTLGLSLVKHSDNIYAVGKREFANPLLFIDTNNYGKEYDGNVTVKAVNLGLFLPSQLYKALYFIDKYSQ